MEKDQKNLVPSFQIKKDRVANFPFYLVSTTFSTQGYFFIIAADYSSQTAILSVYPFRNDMSKLTTSNIQLHDILPRRAISSIHIINLMIKPNTSSVIIHQAQFIIGYRNGLLIQIQYKDKECKVKQRFNKSLKGQSFLSRASSAIFGGDQTYTPYLKGPIRSFTLYNQSQDLRYIWHVGANIIFQKQMSQSKQNRFFSRHESLNLDNFQINYDLNKVIIQGDGILYGCEYYTLFYNKQTSIGIITFLNEISSFIFIEQTKQLIISLSSNEIILIIDLNHYILKTIIKTQLPIRKLNYFIRQTNIILIIMPYQNFIILYSLNHHIYCKLRGHKSYISNSIYNPNTSKIISAGMDHRIGFINFTNIPQQNWIKSQSQGDKIKIIKQYNIIDKKFDQLYHIGQSNINKFNNYSYGFANIFIFYKFYYLPTYDGRIIGYQL